MIRLMLKGMRMGCTPYTNFYLNYKMMTTLSQDTLAKMGPSECFYPDTSDSFMFSTSASPQGIGSSNNKSFGWQSLFPSNEGRIFSTANIAAGSSPVTISDITWGGVIDCLYTTNYPSVNGTAYSTGNFGLFKRTKMWAFNTDNALYTNLLTKASAQTLLKNYFESDTTNHAKVWYLLAQIKLKHVSDLFKEIGLTRGLYWRFIINMNVGTAKLTSALVAGTPGATGAGGYTGAYGTPAYTSYTLATAPTLTQGTFPLIFASSAPGEPNYFLDRTGGNTWYLGCGIVSYTQVAGGASYTTPATFRHQMGTCRLYVPTYRLTPAAESALLEINGGVKTIVYEDILQYNIQNVASGGQVNQLITNGVVSPTKCIIVPMFSTTVDGNGTTLAGPHQSPFASEPGTCSPFTSVTNLNLLLGGQTIFQLNEQYSFQNFTDEVAHTGLNGGITDELSSGLISQYDWENQYGYIVINVERRTGDSDSVIPKSVQLLFQNLSTRQVTYFVYLCVRRSFSINLSTGALVQ